MDTGPQVTSADGEPAAGGAGHTEIVTPGDGVTDSAAQGWPAAETVIDEVDSPPQSLGVPVELAKAGAPPAGGQASEVSAAPVPAAPVPAAPVPAAPVPAAPVTPAELPMAEMLADEDPAFGGQGTGTPVPDGPVTQAPVAESPAPESPGSQSPAPVTGAHPSGADAAPATGSDAGSDGAAAQDTARTLDALAGLRGSLGDLADAAAELSRLRSRDTELIARLHDDVTRLRNGEIAAALNPVVTGMIKLHDQMVSLGALADPASPVGMLHTQLLQIMELTCAVKPFAPAAGDRFDASRHTGMRRIPTTDQAADGTVASTLRVGFARADGSIVRVAEVEVHRLAG